MKWYIEFYTAFTEEDVIYEINITLYETHYMNQSFQIFVTIQYPPSALLIVDTDPGTVVPYGDNLTIIVTHNDTENYQPISGSNIWLEPTSDWPSENYTVSEIDTGVYKIVINTTWENRPEGSYKLIIKASAEHYDNASTATTITIRKIDTSLKLLSYPSYINYGLNATIVLQFNDSDHNTGLTNGIINVYWKDDSGILHIWDGPDVQGQYAVYPNITAGIYTIKLNTSTNLGIGSFEIYINASLDSSWGVWQKHYDMASTIFILQITETDTSFTAMETPEGNIPWGDPFNITVYYRDVVKDVGISTPNITVYGWGNDYLVNEKSTGIYEIEINSSIIDPSQFNELLPVEIRINKTYYKPQILIIYVVIREIYTFFSYTPPDVTPYNNTLTIELFYEDIDHDQPILNNTGKVSITCNVSNYGAVYWTENSTGGKYYLYINTSTLPSAGIYNILINITWSGEPYYQNKQSTL